MKNLFKENRNLIFILIAAGFLVYANTLLNGMFWDDNDFILNNAFVKDWSFLGKYFSENVIAGAGFGSNYWRPVLLFIFSLEYHIWGAWAPGYHFVNMATHTIDALLLFFILFKLFKNRKLAFFTSLIFAIHPVQTEAVAYANSLGDSLSVFFIFFGFFLYQEGRRLGPLMLYSLALMTKETAIIMPGLIMLIDFFSQTSEYFWERVKTVLKKIWPYAGIAGFYILLRATSLNFINTFNLYNEKNTFTSSALIRVLTFFHILTVYLGLLFWPAHLHMERSVSIATSIISPTVLTGALIFAAMLVLAKISWKKWPEVSFGILWFFAGLLPVSNIIVPINGLLYEHWLYLPMIGFFLAVFRFSPAGRFKKDKLFLCIFIILLSLLGLRTILRNSDWHDPVRFYTGTLKYSPSSYRIINNLGMTYAERHEDGLAEETYKRAISLDPKSAVSYYNLGNLLKAEGKINEAISYYQDAINADPKFSLSYRAIAQIYLDGKGYQKAREILEEYLKIAGENENDLFLLYQISVQEKNYGAASNYIKRAIGLDPENSYLQKTYFDIINIEHPAGGG